MCGIFGVITGKNSAYSQAFFNKSLQTLANLSESRGKDSSGICLMNNEKNCLEVIKGPVKVSELLKDKILTKKISQSFRSNNSVRYAFGHARLVTNGSQLNDENNQPVVKEGIVAIHNGIVVNVDNLWAKHPEIDRKYEIDTEILLSLIRHNINQKKSISESVTDSINKIIGTVSTALVLDDLNQFILATNNGSLYTIHNNKDILFFASEQYMLSELTKKLNLSSLGNYKIQQLKANNGIIINLDYFEINPFQLDDSKQIIKTVQKSEQTIINIHSISSTNQQLPTVIDIDKLRLDPKSEKERLLLEYPIEKIKKLKRCTTCLLPETFPFIKFDNHGECNYCKNYKKKNQSKPIEDLQKLVDPYRSKDGSPDIIIPFSGGRDSTFVLHFVKKELGLNPIAYTYDWGMVTDLARRNIARVCGKLGVENIIVAADITEKRRNIRKNITAWLKNPTLGMIPLFMAGDKHFFMYANQIKKQTGIDLNIWGFNFLENTDFKVGFCGVKPDWDKKMIYSMNLKRQLKLFKFVGKNMLTNPSYINSSVHDTIKSFLSRYTNPRKDYFHFFDYYRWNEKEIVDILINEYNWELANDLESTWRIGDGTASFYNYIYTLIAGFSENDTFRSNQIREGMISREKALELIYTENKPRYSTLKWYFEIVGLEYETVIKQINKIPKLY